MNTETTTTPRVWIGCLAAYNAGALHGAWADATLGVDNLEEAAAQVLRTSPALKLGGGVAEELFLADNEGFYGLIGEYDSFERVAELAEALEEHGAPLAAFLDNEGGLSDGPLDEKVERFEEAYAGEHGSLVDYAEELVSECGWGGLAEIPDGLVDYLDFEKIARDLNYSGDFWTADAEGCRVYVFRGNV